MHYLKAAKVGRELLPNITYPRKDTRMETQQFQKMTETRKTTLLRNFLQNNIVCPHQPRTRHPIYKVDLCMEPCFKVFQK